MHKHERDAHLDSIVIAVDGACRGNGRPWARAATGVFFHKYNYAWNYNEVLGANDSTSQRAELCAAVSALALAYEPRGGNPVGVKRVKVPPGPLRRLRRVVMKADSEHLVNAMTDWIYKWQRMVTNADLFKKLDGMLSRLNNRDIEVNFLHVPREQNAAADYLANAALDGVDAQDAFDEDSDN